MDICFDPKFFLFYAPSTTVRFKPLSIQVTEYFTFIFVERFGAYVRERRAGTYIRLYLELFRL